MSYTLENFIADSQAWLGADPGDASQEKVRDALERLLKDPGFVPAHLPPERPVGIYVFHQDEALGFKVLGYVSTPGRVESAPHDHGDSWAIYGQATLHTDMKDFARLDPSEPDDQARLTVTRSYRLNPGDAILYKAGDIHSIHPADHSRYVRLAGSPADAFNVIGPKRRSERSSDSSLTVVE